MKHSLLSISALLIAAVSFAQTTDGLVASYLFNDGTANDGVGTNHGTVHGATLTTDRFGVPNSAYAFNETNEEYISIPTTSDLNFGSNDFSISIWFKTDETGSTGTIINRGEGTGATKRIFIRHSTPGSDDVQWRLGDNSINNVMTQSTTNAGLFDNNWHHLVLVRSTQHMKFYVDGFYTDILTDVLLSIANHNNNRPWLLGAQDSVVSNLTPMGNFFEGGIDDLRFYDRELTIQEIIELYQEQSQVPNIADGILGQWSFNAGTPEDDFGVNDGVNYGSTLAMDRFGNPSQAYDFDNSYIRIPNDGSLSFGTGDFSISAWFNTTESSATGVILNKGESTGSLPRIFIRTNAGSDNRLQWRIGSGNTNLTRDLTDPALFDGNWHHVIVVKIGGAMRFFVDGTLVDQISHATFNNVNVNSSRPILLGVQDSVLSASSPMTSYFDGGIDDVRIYGRAINAAEAMELFNLTDPTIITSTSFEADEDIVVFPNPTKGIINLSNVEFADIHSIVIFSISGKMMFNTSTAQRQIDVSHLPKGMYLMSVTKNDGSRFVNRISKH